MTGANFKSRFEMWDHLFLSKSQELCRVEEHQHQLAHQCSPNIIRIWEWGICGLMGGAFMAYWVGNLYHLMDGAFISLNGWGIYHLMGGAFIT